MDNPEQTDHLEREVERLRAVLRDDSAAPLGMVSRLQSAVAREAAIDAPLGWEPRLVVACLVYVLISAAMPTTPSTGFAPIAATIAVVYVCLVSWAVRPGRE